MELRVNGRMNRCPHLHCQVFKMYHIETEPPNQYRNKENSNPDKRQTLPPPPLVFRAEPSPTPSSEHSTLTSNSFHSTGQQQNISSNYDRCNFLDPQTGLSYFNQHRLLNNKGLNLACHYTRHSSSSIDHKTLNLTRFAEQQVHRNPGNYNAETRYKRSTFGARHIQALNRQVSAEPSDSRSSPSKLAGEHYATSNSSSAKRSNSFQQNKRSCPNPSGSFAQVGNPKRCSVNLTLGAHHSPSSARHFQRHQSTPVPPPRAPTEDEDTSVSSFSRPPSTWSPRQMAQQLPSPNAVASNNSMQIRDQRESNPIEGRQSGNMLSHLEQQQGTDSLDNIHMIVDEDNGGSFAMPAADDQLLDSDRFMFTTSDEPYKMSTLKVAGGASKQAKKTISFSRAPDAIIAGGSQHSDMQQSGSIANGAMLETDRKTLASAAGVGTQNEHNFPNGLDHVVHFNDDVSLQQQTILPGYGERQTRDQELRNGYAIQGSAQTRHQAQRLLVYESRK